MSEDATSDNGERCEICRFFLGCDEPVKGSHDGFCRRFPPPYENYQFENENFGYDNPKLPPRVYRDDWCGEFRSQEDQRA